MNVLIGILLLSGSVYCGYRGAVSNIETWEVIPWYVASGIFLMLFVTYLILEGL